MIFHTKTVMKNINSVRDVPSGVYLFKTNNRNKKTVSEICSRRTIKTLDRRYWRRSVVFIINFEQISNIAQVNLNK